MVKSLTYSSNFLLNLGLWSCATLMRPPFPALAHTSWTKTYEQQCKNQILRNNERKGISLELKSETKQKNKCGRMGIYIDIYIHRQQDNKKEEQMLSGRHKTKLPTGNLWMCSSKPGLERSVAYLTKIFGLKPKDKRGKGEYIYSIHPNSKQIYRLAIFFSQSTWPMLVLASGRPVLTLRNLAWPWREEVDPGYHHLKTGMADFP